MPRVNEVAAAVRWAAGAVAWVKSHMPVNPRHFVAILGVERAANFGDVRPSKEVIDVFGSEQAGT